jgi:flavorubredoxin
MTTAIVVYDAWYGCTQAVAEEVARGLSSDGRVVTVVANVKTVKARQVLGHDIIVVGSPNHRGGPTARIRRLLEQLRAVDLYGRRFAFFDTCFAPAHGRAVSKMEAILRHRSPYLFPSFMSLSVMVRRSRGPILPGELSKCRALGKSIRAGLEIPA